MSVKASQHRLLSAVLWREDPKKQSLLFLAELGPVFVLIVALVIASIASPRFFSVLNLRNVASQSAVFIVLAVGMTFVITGGGIDLSIGSQVALIGVVMARWILVGEVPAALAIIMAILFGVLLGAFNGSLIAVTGIPDFIITLAGMEIFRGLALLHSGGEIWQRFPPLVRGIATNRVAGLPVAVIIAIIFVLIGVLLYQRTYYGRYTVAIGGNPRAAEVSGISRKRYKLYNYMVMGGLSGVAAILLVSRINSAQATMAMQYEIHVIAAVIMGGTSLFGGRGSISGSFVGALILAIIGNIMVLIGVDFFWRLVATGFIIIIAVALNLWRERVLRENT